MDRFKRIPVWVNDAGVTAVLARIAAYLLVSTNLGAISIRPGASCRGKTATGKSLP